ncbi:helix-turn-helix domain-containing protein [Solwaraspora sp. WMMD1047]|uniref:helix-turn-helix domain-containing protein n=1 Tax=Solwaraspora sp. WMMD1047 TaxID=3016102 RepID=UPI002416662E|nr:helix-turn-helix domain-containing protein [Solwaraspora sp. WMMD1047]MDG4830673.1 helix-turn-helix domain-containing protein [Solwaraspora sp. WMMD1047]
MGLRNNVALLRRLRGWTQEELAERCGLSVRTIRNVELGSVDPRRSSVKLILRALDAGEVTEGPRGLPTAPDRWRGLPPPRHPIVGMRAELHELARTVLASRLTAVVGPGGVGKTRIALGVAAEIASTFRHGVIVVELGDIPAEEPVAPPPTAVILERVTRLIDPESTWTDRRTGGDAPGADAGLLILLDNAEHLPSAVAAAGKELLNAYPRAHILITSRRPVTDRWGLSREIRPLPVEPEHQEGGSLAPAVELVLRRASVGLPAAADLARDLPQVVELCRRLAGIPRALEFAAERLRTIPIRSLLAAGPALSMLSTSDHSLAPHQRSVAGSIRWSIDLLSDGHRWLLRHIAGLPHAEFDHEQVLAAAGADQESVLCHFSDLVDHGLITACRDHLYRYRLMPYVGEVVGADLDASPVPV